MVGIIKNPESVLRKTLFGVLEKNNLMTGREQFAKFQFVKQLDKLEFYALFIYC